MMAVLKRMSRCPQRPCDHSSDHTPVPFKTVPYMFFSKFKVHSRHKRVRMLAKNSNCIVIVILHRLGFMAKSADQICNIIVLVDSLYRSSAVLSSIHQPILRFEVLEKYKHSTAHDT